MCVWECVLLSTSFSQVSAICNGGRDASCTALLRFLAALRRFLATVALRVAEGESATGLEEKAPDVAVGTISWTAGIGMTWDD